MTTYVITSSLSLARVLWWYGEDELWPRARALEPSAVADLAEEFARYMDPGLLAEIWPGTAAASEVQRIIRARQAS